MRKVVYVLVSAAVSQALFLLNLFAPLFGILQAVGQYRRSAATPSGHAPAEGNARQVRR